MPQHPRFWKTKDGSVALTNKNLLFRPHCFKSRLALYEKKNSLLSHKMWMKGIHATMSLQILRFHYWKKCLSRYSRNKTLQCRKFDWGFFYHLRTADITTFFISFDMMNDKKKLIFIRSSENWVFMFTQRLTFDVSGGKVAKLNFTTNAKGFFLHFRQLWFSDHKAKGFRKAFVYRAFFLAWFIHDWDAGEKLQHFSSSSMEPQSLITLIRF